MDTWNVITRGAMPKYRVQPGSVPQARIPAGNVGSTFAIGYYGKDVRRNQDPAINSPIDDSFTEANKKLLAAPKLAGVDAGSPGQKVSKKNHPGRHFLGCACVVRHALCVAGRRSISRRARKPGTRM